MFNTNQYNTQQYNAGIVGITGVVTGDITYGGYILHKTDNIHLNFADINNGSSIEANTYDLPNTDGIGLNSYFKRAKTVLVRGSLSADNKEDLEKSMRTMLQELATPNKLLQVINAGSYQRAKAYVTNLDNIFRRQHYNNTWVPFEIRFTIGSPFWEGVELQAVTYNTTTALQEEIFNMGTTITEPVTTLSFTTSNSTEVSVVFGDYQLNITETLTDNDIIKIDSQTKQVLLNGTAIDYTGQLPLLKVGSNPITITPNGTFNCDISINYRNKFI